MKNSERIYGLDLLKILLVFGVIFLHLIGKGGVIANSRYHSFTYWNIYLLQIILFCCVNCILWKEYKNRKTTNILVSNSFL